MTPADQLPQDGMPLDEEPAEHEKYWADKQASDVVTALADKESGFFESVRRRGLLRMWRAQWAQYFGQNPDAIGGFESQMISVAGEDGEFLNFCLNEARPIISRQIQMAVGERAAFQCHATNSDFKTRAQIVTCDKIVDYVYRESHAERKERDIVESDSNFGAGFGWARWDRDAGDDIQTTEQMPTGQPDGSTGPVPRTQKSGAPTVTVCYPWEMVQEPSVKSHMWRLVRERRSKWELIAAFPDLADKIRALKGLDEYTTEQLFGIDDDNQSEDDLIVKHFYHERGGPIPAGRYLMFTGDVVLKDEGSPVSKGMPIQEMCSEKFIGSSFGYASGWGIIAPTQMSDQILSDGASNLATFGRQVIGVYEGTDFDVDALANGHRCLTLPQGSDPPIPISFAGIPEAARWMLEYCLRARERISGINATAMGDPAGNVSSGTYAALLHSIAIEFQGPRQTAFDEYREGMANLQLDLVRQRATTPFLVAIAGLDQRPYLQQFTADTLSGVKRVTVKTANPMMRSQAGRLEIFNAVKTIAIPADRAAAIELITSGDASDFAKVERSEKMCIEWENEQLAQGIDVPVSVIDNPQTHFLKHKAEVDARREQLMQDPTILAVYLKHILDHQNVYASQMSPIIAEWLGIPPPPAYRMQMGPGGQPANTNGQPPAGEGSMAGAEGNPAKAAQNAGAGAPTSDVAQRAGAEMPQPAEPPPAPPTAQGGQAA